MKLTDNQIKNLILLLAFGNGHSRMLMESKDNSPEQRFVFSSFRHKFETTIQMVNDGVIDYEELKIANKMFTDFMSDWAEGLECPIKEFSKAKNSNYHVLLSNLQGFEKAVHKLHKENKKKEKTENDELFLGVIAQEIEDVEPPLGIEIVQPPVVVVEQHHHHHNPCDRHQLMD